ncbi:substrate-binding domain-containing protein [Actinomycetes bacterium KLBMP 9797]
MRRLRLTDPRVVWLSVALVLVLVAWGTVVSFSTLLRPSGCQSTRVLRVAAAPSIAAAVQAAAPLARVDCVRVDVLARNSALFTEALAEPALADEPAPHVWLPESTFWLGRARASGVYELPERGTSVASSPVVVAMTEPVALQLDWPRRPVPWSALLGPAPAAGVPVGLPDPATDPVGVAALVGVQAVTARRPDATAAALRRLVPHTVTRVADLYQRLPEAGSGADTLHAFLSTEQALLRHNTRQRGVPLVAAYPGATVPTLDYPYAVLPGTGADEVGVAARLLAALLSPAGQRALAAEGFRAPDGAPPTGTALKPAPPVPMPGEDALVDVLSAWTGVHLSARILGVVDVSGSMAERVPGGDTRLGATMRAAQEGVGLLLDTTDVGVWLFSTALEGDRPYRVLAPTRPLSEQRGQLVGRLGQVRANSGGATALYDTTLAAYQSARRNWAPGRINVVLIATDGKDDNASRISRAQLLAGLRELHDPRRPLPILFIGIGGDIDRGELNEIAKATGGRVFESREPSGIRQIFFSALADLSCQPPSCRQSS